jgi:glycerophosphoryl diester phosphodiesterase
VFEQERPLLIAHRYGNRLDALAAATGCGAQLIEIDVWYHRGRLEVGHDKTLGPIPLRWDRWSLALGRSRPLSLAALLARFPEGVAPMFDLKGEHPALPDALLRATEDQLPHRPYAVSSQNWDFLDAFLGVGEARVIRSIGSEQAVARMRGDLPRWSGAGVGFNQELLTPSLIEEFAAGTPLIVTWTVNAIWRAQDLLRQGVGGIISDNLELIRRLADPPPAASAGAAEPR